MRIQEASCCSRRAVYTSPGFFVLFSLIAVIFLAAPLFPRPTLLALDAVAFAAGAAWCALNFRRGRQVHCAVTSIGWTALALLAFFEAARDRSFIAGDEQLVFLGLLGIALIFEDAWHRAFDAKALRPQAASGTVNQNREPLPG